MKRYKTTKEDWRKEYKDIEAYLRFGILCEFVSELKERKKKDKGLVVVDRSDVYTKCIDKIKALLEEVDYEWQCKIHKIIEESYTERKRLLDKYIFDIK